MAIDQGVQGRPAVAGGEVPLLRTTEGLVVGVAGRDAVRAPLTWGQRRVASLTAQLRPGHATLNVRLACELRADVTTRELRDALAATVGAYESLRARYVWDDPVSEQEVLPAIELVCEVDVADVVDAGVAFAHADDLASAAFAPDELPVRVRVLRDARRVFLVLVVSHLATDHYGVDHLLWYLRDVVSGMRSRAADPGPHAAQPRDVAAWEASAAGTEAGRRAVARHARVFHRMPPTMLPGRTTAPLEPRYRYWQLRSTASWRCLSWLRSAHGVSETAVLHAVLSAVLATAGNQDACVMQVCVANRSRSTTATAVVPLTQDVPVLVPVAGCDLATLVRRSAAALVTAVALGRFPPDALDHARAQAEEERQVSLDLSCWLNSRLRAHADGNAPRPTPQDLALARAGTTLEEVGADPTSTSSVFTYAERDGEALVLRMMVDSARVGAQEVRDWLRAVEAVLESAVLDPTLDAITAALAAGVRPRGPLQHAMSRDTTQELRDDVPQSEMRVS